MSNSFRIIDFNESIKLNKDRLGGWLDQARKDVASLEQKQKLKTARKHFMNALQYRAPRLQSEEMSLSVFFNFVYTLQTSLPWQTVLLLLSYLFMYMILFTAKKPQLPQQIVEFIILGIFWLDVVMELYHKQYQILRTKSKFQSRFYVKIVLLTLFLVDEFLAVLRQDQNVFLRPFLVLRCMLPTLYDKTLRKNIQAIMALYKDIIVFTFFYGSVILLFTFLVQRMVIASGYKDYDEFTENYVDFPRALFLMYSLSTFESYPDNQLKAIQANHFIYFFFILFLILNLFLFITIPTSLLFNQFKQVRSRIILVDQIKQQNSLILAFTCLCGEDLEITTDKFMRFLMLCFRNKVGYVEEITKIVMEVDENKNKKIQITEFMQIIKIMYSHPSLSPPMFDDWQPWINFRASINTKYGIKDLVQGKKFKIIVIFIIFFAVINCLLNIFLPYHIFEIIDDIIAFVFILELVLKMVGLGPENFFKDPWNKLDFVLILLIALTEIWPNLQKSAHVDVLLKLMRSYRIALLPQYLFDKGKYILLDHFWVRVSRLITQILITIPLVLEFFPMYAIFFYFFGVLGLQIYGNLIPMQAQKSSYSKYDDISNFETFLSSQFYMVQVMIEAGWSTVAFDHAYRFPFPIMVTLFFFAITHFSLTLVVSSLVKGVTWQVYQTVQRELQNKVLKQMNEMKEDQKFKQRKQQLETVKNQMNLNQPMQLENLIQRQIFEGKVDLEIINKMKLAAKDPKNDYMARKKKNKTRHLLMPMLIKQLSNNSLDDLDMHLMNNKSAEENNTNVMLSPSIQIKSDMNLSSPNQKSQNLLEEEAHDDAEIDQQIQKLIGEAAIDGKNAYLQTITYPAQLLEILSEKILTVQQYEAECANQKYARELGQSQGSPLINRKSKRKQSKLNDHSVFRLDSINSLLGIEGSERQRKMRVISDCIDRQIIPLEEGKKLVYKKKEQPSIWMSPTWILRETFLRETSQKSVQKFELEYFSKICGEDFKEINQNTIQPLLRLESKLIYALRNALRYRKIDQLHFFTMLNKIQDEISSKLLKRGSLFKFVYQIDSINQSWFTTEVIEKSRIKAHFIKNGIWIWQKNMRQNQLYVGQDFFYLKELQQESSINSKQDPENRHYYLQKCAKLLYQTFESLAMGLPTQSNFFVSNPSAELYNLYFFWRNVEEVKRKQERFCISKIMPVILSHQGPRMHNNQQECLKYDLTDLKIQVQKTQKINIKRENIFELEDTYRQIQNWVSKVETKDEVQIQESEGLPHSFIVNLMDQISDVLATYEQNFVYRLENLINKNILLEPFANSLQFSLGPNMESINIRKKWESSQQDLISNFSLSSCIEQQQKPEDRGIEDSNLIWDSFGEIMNRPRVMTLQTQGLSSSYRSQFSEKEQLPTKDPI